MKIDCHVHIGKHASLDIDNSYEYYIDKMDNSHVDCAVVFGNQHYKNPERHDSNRFHYWYWCDMLNPQEPQSKAVGIKLHGTVDKVDYLSLQAVECVNYYVERGHDLFILHTSGRMEHARVEKAVHLANQFPYSKFILCHLGTTSLEQNLRFWHSTTRLPDNIYWDTSAVKAEYSLMSAYEKVGAERLIFGSDSPWMSLGASVQMIEEMPITDGEKEMIFSGNIRRLME